MASPKYDVIIVGAGMFGASAAKHVRHMDKEKKLRVAIIGPDVNTTDLCRGQHFDEARICRRVETLTPWSYLNNDGVTSFEETEKESGIKFHTPCGLVWVATEADKDEMAACMHKVVHDVTDPARRPFHFYDNADGKTLDTAKDNILAVLTSAEAAESQFEQHVSVHQFADKTPGKKTYYIVEKGPHGAGTVHPTHYVEAQLKCAAQVAPKENFTHIADQVVTGIHRHSKESEAPEYEVKTNTGKTYLASKVLVAAASFAVYHDLIPKKAQELFLAVPEHVVLLRVNPPGAKAGVSSKGPRPEDVEASHKLPAVIRTTGPSAEQFYCLPPRYYADENMQGWFIKMGGVDSHDMAAELKREEDRKSAAAANEAHKLHEEGSKKPRYDVSNLKAAMDWYDGRTPLHETATAHLTAMLSTVYPKWHLVGNKPEEQVHGSDGKPLKNSFVVRCIWDLTMGCGPVIDKIADSDAATSAAHSGLYIALGGNGRGAKACDPIGRLAAMKLLNGADAPLPKEYGYYKDLYKAV